MLDSGTEMGVWIIMVFYASEFKATTIWDKIF
jgi:hypothetical protein